MCKYTYTLYAYICAERESERERFMAKTKPTFAETAFSGDNFSAVALQKQQHAHVNTTWDSYIKIQSPLLYFLFYCVGDMDWLPLSESQLGTEWMSGGNWCTQSARHPLILIHEHTLRFKRVWVLASEAWESSGFLCVPRRKVGHCHDALQSLFVRWKHSTSHTGWVTPVYATWMMELFFRTGDHLPQTCCSHWGFTHGAAGKHRPRHDTGLITKPWNSN